jgi:UPF0716 protein FxsA
MGALILIAMIGVPIAEIAVFIEVGEKIGLGPTLFIVVATAIMGTALLRQQGFSVLARAQASLQENRFPMHELFDGLCLVFAGALLLTPGFVTDTVGFLLFMPPFRALLRAWGSRVLASRGQFHMEQGIPSGGFGQNHPHGSHQPEDSSVIDGEFSDITDTDPSDTGPDRRLPPK